MKKLSLILLSLTLLTCGRSPGSRPWIVPVSADPSDLDYTPEHDESYRLRRRLLSDSIGDAAAILFSGLPESRNRHEFRPNNYFYYFTGYARPHTYALVHGGDRSLFTMAIPDQTIRSLIYEGPQPSRVEIGMRYRPDRILDRMEFRGLVDSILNAGLPVYADPSQQNLLHMLRVSSNPDAGPEIRDIALVADELRVIKEEMEVERIQKACHITARALVNAMKTCTPKMYEFEIESVIEGTFLQYGAAMPGFSSIVGSGPNTTILHYQTNNRRMEKGDLLLMDVGAEYGYYTADITRTIPVSGRFSKEQKTIYRLVLDAQKAAIETMKPGNTFMDGHTASTGVIVKGLDSLGLITDPGSSWQTRFYVLYPSSHYLGMDVHDVGDKGGSFSEFIRQTGKGVTIPSRMLEPGMVLTIEPGLYFREGGLDQIHRIFSGEADSLELVEFVEAVRPVYNTYRNIGVRIEDDILITGEGNLNLSRYAPKEIADIENLMK